MELICASAHLNLPAKIKTFALKFAQTLLAALIALKLTVMFVVISLVALRQKLAQGKIVQLVAARPQIAPQLSSHALPA